MTETINHGFPALIDENSEILILGSFPSVKSRNEGFYYGYPQNRFWKVLARITGDLQPNTIEEKKRFCFVHHFALYDSVYECSIVGSSDSSIKNVKPADLKALLSRAPIKKIILNGKAAEKYFRKYQRVSEDITVITCPSTSPANAACSLDGLVLAWSKAILGS